MNKQFFLFLIISLSFFSFSQKEKKLIEEGKFTQAHTLLTKSYAKDSSDVEIVYYLSMLYIQESAQEYYSVKSSYEYYLKTKNIYSMVDAKRNEKLKKAGITTESILILRDTIFHSAYRESIATNTEEAYTKFIELDKEIPLVLLNEIIEKRSITAFNNSKIINSVSSFDKFILNYPNSKQYLEAVEIRDSLAFENSKLINSILVYKEYITKYPDSKYVNVAEINIHQLAFEEAKIQNSITSYNNFLLDYPKSIQSSEVMFKIEELHFKEIIEYNSIDKCYSFINKFQKSIFKDSVFTILENLKYQDLNKNLSIPAIQNFISEFPSSIKNNYLSLTLDSLYFVNLSNSQNIEEIQDFITNYPNTKHFKYFKEKIDYLTDIQIELDFNDLDIFIHPNYFEEFTSLEVRNISFFDADFHQKLEFTTNISYDLANKFNDVRIGPNGKECHNCGAISLGSSFKVLNNKWFFWNDKLFKNLNGVSKGIKGGDINASNKSRSFTFSDSIVIDGNGYIINLFENKMYSYNSCKSQSLLKTNMNLSTFEEHKPIIQNKQYKFLPYWANNPSYVEFVPSEHTIFNSIDNLIEKCDKICIHNDSLVFFTIPIGYSPKILDYPINKKIEKQLGIETFEKNINNFEKNLDDTDEIGFKYFFRKYNLTETVPFDPSNFLYPKNDAFVIAEFNHVLNKLNIIYDAGISNLMPIKLMLDKTNSLLIVQSVDDIEDDFNSDFSHRFEVGPNGENNLHHSVTIFDLETKRELVSFPGYINDLTDENLLIINGFMVWTPQCIYYDQLNLNELISNKKAFTSPKIIQSMQLDEFMSSSDMILKMNLLREENKVKSENRIVKKAPILFPSKNKKNDEFINFVENENSNLCGCYYEKLNNLPDSLVVLLNYVEYDLGDNKRLTLESAPLNDFNYHYLSDLECDNWVDVNFPCKFRLSNGLTYSIYAEYETRKVKLFLFNVEPEFAKRIKDKVKVQIQFDHNMVFNPEKIENYYKNPLVEDCIKSSNDSNKENLLELFGSYGAIDNSYVPYVQYNLNIDGQKIFLKFR